MVNVYNLILCKFLFQKMFLKKIKNDLVCDQYKIMQRIVCQFLFFFKNACISSNEKAPSEPAGSSSLLHTARLGEIHICCLCILIAQKLQSGSTQHCTEAALNGLPVSALNGFSQSTFLSSCLCNIYTSEQPFPDNVSSLEDTVLCHNCEQSHHYLTYIYKCALSDSVFIIASLRFLFYLSVLSAQMKLFIFLSSSLGVILVIGAAFFSSQTCQKIWEQHSNAPSCLVLPNCF